MFARSLPPVYARVAIFVLAAGLDLYRIDHVALWNDEAFSFFAAISGPAHTLRFIADDTQPPFYYLVLSLWLHLGSSVFVIRALSAAAMVLALIPVHAAAKRLFNERVALLAMLLFALAPMVLGWAQRARPYPLQALLVAVAFWGFVRISLDLVPRYRLIGASLIDAARRREASGAVTDFAWGAYVLGGALAMLTQHPAGFFVLGCNAAMALLIFADLRAGRLLLLNWVIAQLVLIGIWATWVPAMLNQISQHLTPEQIETKHRGFLVTGEQLLGTLESLFSVAGLYRLSVVFVPLYGVVVLIGLWHVVRKWRRSVALLGPIIVPVGVCLLGFWLVHPIFGYAIGTFAWITAPYVILVAAGLLAIRPAILRWGVIALVLAGNAWGDKGFFEMGTPPLDRVAAVIKADEQPGDALVFSDKASGRWGVGYYLGPPWGHVPGEALADWGTQGMITSADEALRYRRIWVALAQNEAPAFDLKALDGRMKRVFDQPVGPYRVMRYDLCVLDCR